MAKKLTQDFINGLSNNKVILDHNDPLAQKSGIDGEFQIILQPLLRTEKSNLELQHIDPNDNTKVTADYAKALFMSQVKSWTGLFVDDYEQDIPADDKMKEMVFEYPYFSQYSNLILSKIAEIEGIKTKKEEDIKKNVENESLEMQSTETSAGPVMN